MGIIGFLSNVANNFRNHYLDLAEKISPEPQRYRDFSTRDDTSTRSRDLGDRYEPQTAAEAADTDPKDTVELSGDTPAPATESDDLSDDQQATPSPAEEKTDEVRQRPDGTYTYRRESRLDYEISLQFDLAAIRRTVRSLAEGDSETVEQMIAAGFGLSADMNFRGFSSVEQSGARTGETQPATHARGLNMLRSRQANEFAAASRNFGVESFFRDSTKMMHSMDKFARDGYTRAMNRFAMRYRMDTRFSFAHLQRLNVQTAQMADQAPESLSRYFNSAGSVAENGSGDMMAAFFDAVDAYLQQAEGHLLQKAVGSFEQAVADLGFSEALTDTARAHITDTIESFFDRVDGAIDSMRTRFGVEPGEEIIPPADREIPDESVDPAVLHQEDNLARIA